MSAFDATIRVGEASVQPIEEENGNSYEAHLILGVISVLPVGPGQAVPFPLGAFRVPLSKQTLDALYDEIGRVREVVKERPNIAIAGSLDGVDRAAEFNEGLRGT